MKEQNHPKGRTIPGYLFIFVLILALLFTSCQAQSTNTGGSQTTQAASQQINVENSAFNPKQLTIKTGTTVVWTNKDVTVHTVTADDNSFDSGNLNQGNTFQFTFTKPGTYLYYCKLHGGPNGKGMSGTIVVSDNG
jgi:plastocyanin